MKAELGARKAEARAIILAEGRVVVALSGGVDSAVLLSLSVEALGADRVVAVTGRSASLASSDLADARAVAASMGVRHQVVETQEMSRVGYRANAGDRCFHCRSELFSILDQIRCSLNAGRVLYGAIKDDEADFRPGMRAAQQHGVLAPLQMAGMTKADVRDLARAAGLNVREKPAGACLASRIPVGTPVTAEALAQVERAEAGLRSLGLGQFRVRHHGEVARLELDGVGEGLLADPGLRNAAVQAVRGAGFRFVALDLEGYRAGSLNPTRLVQSIGPKRESGQ